MKRFKRIYIETTNICNKSCNFCPKTNRQLNFMQSAEFEKIVKAIKAYTNYVYLHVMGEPLLNENLPIFLQLCEEHKLQVNLTTNGTLLRQKLAILKNAKALRKVAISLHSFEAENIGELTDYIDSCIDAVNVLKGKVICEFRLWNLSENQAANPLNQAIIKHLKNSFGYAADQPKGKSFKLADNVYLMLAQQFDWPDIGGKYYGEKGYCQALKSQIAILVDGTVVPCCLDNNANIVLGNIFYSTMQEILNSEKAVKMLNSFKSRNRIEQLCKHCQYSERFS